MKIEILEQAFASYLRNCEGCLISQTNWRVTPKMMESLTPADFKEAEQIIDEMKKATNINVLKQSTIRQFISQCEIDIVGLKSNKTSKEIYLFDTAFHEKGLNYKDNAPNVCKKIIRAAIIGKLFFDGYKVHVGFVSPKCNKAPLNRINALLPSIDKIIQKHSSSIDINTYINDMCSLLITELASMASLINDDVDLFVRSVKLLELTNKLTISSNNKATVQPSNQINQDNRAIIYNVIDQLQKNNKLTPQLVGNLCDVDFSKKTFKLSGYPFMIEATKIPSKDHRRYYARCFIINGKTYRVCSQWYDDRLLSLQNWIKTI